MLMLLVLLQLTATGCYHCCCLLPLLLPLLLLLQQQRLPNDADVRDGLQLVYLSTNLRDVMCNNLLSPH